MNIIKSETNGKFTSNTLKRIDDNNAQKLAQDICHITLKLKFNNEPNIYPASLAKSKK